MPKAARSRRAKTEGKFDVSQRFVSIGDSVRSCWKPQHSRNLRVSRSESSCFESIERDTPLNDKLPVKPDVSLQIERTWLARVSSRESNAESIIVRRNVTIVADGYLQLSSFEVSEVQNIFGQIIMKFSLTCSNVLFPLRFRRRDHKHVTSKSKQILPRSPVFRVLLTISWHSTVVC